MVRSNSQTSLLAGLHTKRATLSDTGILIKDQGLYLNDNSSISSCLTCSSIDTLPGQGIKYIPYFDILSARYTDESHDYVTVSYAQRRRTYLVPLTISLQIDSVNAIDLIEEIYSKAYPHSSPNKSILTLVNPHGGKGSAIKLFLERAKPILEAADAKVTIVETEYGKHAIDIVKELDISQYDIIACASGDGIPYEVFNGLYQRPDRALAFNKLVVTQIPCGSGNAMSESCHWTGEPSFAALSILKSKTVNIDLMAVTQDNKTSISFLSQTLGIIADADIDTEHLRFLGSKRFDLGVFYKVLSRAKYPCELYVKYAAQSKDELRKYHRNHVDSINEELVDITDDTFKLKYDASAPVPDNWVQIDRDLGNNLGIFYTGKMPYISKNVQFFPAALPNDGSFDLIMLDARTSITRQAPILLSLETGKHVTAPEVHHSKIFAYRLIPKYTTGLLSIDGERYDSREIQVEILPNAAKTLLNNGAYLETSF